MVDVSLIALRGPVLAAALLFAAVPARAAGGDIFLCTDADGRRTYQNTGGGKGCTRVDVSPYLTVPAPRAPAARAPAESARPISPASFPRVDGATQRTRDSDRRRILEDELDAEQKRLESLRAEFNGGAPQRLPAERSDALYQERLVRLRADLERSESNITALRRELALLARP